MWGGDSGAPSNSNASDAPNTSRASNGSSTSDSFDGTDDADASDVSDASDDSDAPDVSGVTDAKEPDWSRVAILLRSSTRASLFADALRREGIPAELTGGGSLFEEPIVRDLRSVLRVIDNPRDDVALAATLRTPAFSFGNADLLRIRLAFPSARGFLDAVIGVAYGEEEIPETLAPPGEPERFGQPDEAWTDLVPAELRRRCRDALERVAQWREEEPWSELPALVARVADSLHLVPLGFASGEGSRQRACLERFLGLARAYESERGPSLHGFLGRIDLLDEADAVETVPATRGESRGVRILTVHKSKGLEFPVVVVPQLDWRVSTKDRLASRIRIDRDWVGLRWFDETTYTRRESVVRQLLEWRQEEALREEEARILYVAMTRAEEKLLLFGMHRGLPESKSLPEGVWDHERRHASTMLTWIVGALPWSEMHAVDPELLSALGLAPAETATLAGYHSRYGTGTAPLPAEEMDACPQRSSEYRLGDIRVSLVSKVVLAAALAETALAASTSASSGGGASTQTDAARVGADDHAGADVGRESVDAGTGTRGDVAAAPEPAIGQTYDMFAALADAASDHDPVPSLRKTPEPASAPVPALTPTSVPAPASIPSTAGVVLELEDDPATIEAIVERAARRRPIPPIARLTSLRGKYWVTEFKSETDVERADALREDATAFWIAAEGAPVSAADPEAVQFAPKSSDARETRANLGTLYHGWLARIPFADMTAEGVRPALAAEARTEGSTETLRDDEIESGLEAFFRSEWGTRLRAAGAQIEREIPFSLKWSVDELCHALPALRMEIDALDAWTAEEWAAELAHHWVLLQGRLDCVFPHGEGWVVLDWKTDRVTPTTIDARAEKYETQMRFYRDAVRRLWGGPVTSVLVFARTGDVRVTED
ncbi:MAG: 3'-5' exonuclease [Candidatus Eisenbacteria bacterium]